MYFFLDISHDMDEMMILACKEKHFIQQKVNYAIRMFSARHLPKDVRLCTELRLEETHQHCFDDSLSGP